LIFKPNLFNSADITLLLNDEEIGKGEVPLKFGVAYFSYDEGFDVGRDLLTPVSDSYKSPFAFTGKLEKITIDYKAPLTSQLVSKAIIFIRDALIAIKGVFS
jgi:arylsulfatase